MMRRYEYMPLKIEDLFDLDQLNRFADDGWRVAHLVSDLSGPQLSFAHIALLEREMPR